MFWFQYDCVVVVDVVAIDVAAAVAAGVCVASVDIIVGVGVVNVKFDW